MSAPIVYFELAGPDDARMKAFYSGVFEWNIDADNSIVADSTGGLRGGIRRDAPETLLYLGVADIEATLKRIVYLGGTVVIPRTVVPNLVTFALFTDPAGNRIGLVELSSTSNPASGTAL